MTSEPKRIAIYARVSTTDKGQDPETQLREMRSWIAAKGYILAGEYVDYESGRKGADKRERFAALFEDASRRKCDGVLVWALDRLSREGMVETLQHLQKLTSYGVAFHSYTEAVLSTENELTRNIVAAVLAAMAKSESEKISVRVKAGLARAKANGVVLGRKLVEKDPKKAGKLAKALDLLAQGWAIQRTARECGLGCGTVTR